MKKLILILVIAFVAFAASSQTRTTNIAERNSYAAITADYTLTNTTTQWFLWNAARDMPATQDYTCIVDSLAGNHTNIAISLYGRKFESSDWSQIGSTVNSTAGTDTLTISNTGVNRFRSYKTEFVLTGTGTTTLDEQRLKIYNE